MRTPNTLPPIIRLALLNAICEHGQTDQKAVLTDESRQVIFNEVRQVMLLVLPRRRQLSVLYQVIDFLEQSGQVPGYTPDGLFFAELEAHRE